MGRKKGSKNKEKKGVNEERTDTKTTQFQLTINNPSPEEEDVLATLTGSGKIEEIKYCKWAHETGGDKEGKHMHIFLILKTPIQWRFSAIKKIWPRSHVEHELKGTVQQNLDYIGNPDFIHSEKHGDKNKAGKRKGGTVEYVKTYGDLEGVRLGRTKGTSTLDDRLLAMKRMIDEGCSIDALYDADFPIMIRYGKQLEGFAARKKMIDSADRYYEMKDTLIKQRTEDEHRAIQEMEEWKRQIIMAIEDGGITRERKANLDRLIN